MATKMKEKICNAAMNRGRSEGAVICLFFKASCMPLPETDRGAESVDLCWSLGHAGIDLDFAERLFVLNNILFQDGHERLGLLRAQVDALEVLHLDVARALRLNAAKDQQKIPHADTHLHGICVTLSIIGGVQKANIRLLRRMRHKLRLLKSKHEHNRSRWGRGILFLKSRSEARDPYRHKRCRPIILACLRVKICNRVICNW